MKTHNIIGNDKGWGDVPPMRGFAARKAKTNWPLFACFLAAWTVVLVGALTHAG